MLSKVKSHVELSWRLAKLAMALLCLWGLTFSFVTIANLGAAFDYDETLVTSAGAFEKARAGAVAGDRQRFWTIVNRSYDLERPKLISQGLAWTFKALGFRVTILAARPDVETEALRKEWRRLVPRNRFVFTGESGARTRYLEEGNAVVFFTNRDADVADARKAKVLAVRIKRGTKGSVEDYHPGTMNEVVLPLSEF